MFRSPCLRTVECPYYFYRALRAQGSVYRVPGRGFDLVSNYDRAMQVIKDTDPFSSASGVAAPRDPQELHPGGPAEVRTLLTADAQEHHRG